MHCFLPKLRDIGKDFLYMIWIVKRFDWTWFSGIPIEVILPSNPIFYFSNLNEAADPSLMESFCKMWYHKNHLNKIVPRLFCAHPAQRYRFFHSIKYGTLEIKHTISSKKLFSSSLFMLLNVLPMMQYLNQLFNFSKFGGLHGYVMKFLKIPKFFSGRMWCFIEWNWLYVQYQILYRESILGISQSRLKDMHALRNLRQNLWKFCVKCVKLYEQITRRKGNVCLISMSQKTVE